MESARVVGLVDGNLNRRRRTDANMLNNDRRRSIIWNTSEIGVVYDCFTVLHVYNVDYCPALDTDYKCFSEFTMMSVSVGRGDLMYHYFWNVSDISPTEERCTALPFVTVSYFADWLM